MPIYFRSTPVSAPYMFDSIGNHWLEEATCRPEGYPHYHYLQTESGCGEIEIQGKIYELQENEGFLIAPSIPHSYKRKSDTWFTLFATFTGTLEASIPSLIQNRSVLGLLSVPMTERFSATEPFCHLDRQQPEPSDR